MLVREGRGRRKERKGCQGREREGEGEERGVREEEGKRDVNENNAWRREGKRGKEC